MAEVTEERRVFGERLCKIRNRLGLSQEEFAERLSCTDNTISRYENGQSAPDIFMTVKIMKEFNLDFTELFPEMAGYRKTDEEWNQVIFKANRLSSANKEAVIQTAETMADNLLEAEKKLHVR